MTDIISTPRPGIASCDPSPHVRRILGETRAMLRESGWESVSMRRLAARLGVKAPSLYKHISGKKELYGLLLEETKERLAHELAAAWERDATVASLLDAYRAAALADPHGYLLLARGRTVLRSGEGEKERDVIAAFQDAAGGDRARGLAMWAFAHGLVTAEITQEGARPEDADGVWAAGAAAFGG
ncbi:TetR/AcrR family transcriptional regulator [Corynebacterium sp. 335C]